ncbi:unnamed protein product [Anisakis simplex]|uniref:PABS domain-containing protein n=1 Tax=Anisakis simplex TaxID=6269 RepID=A0A158PPC8_ANISI|nr:unnamed protein product [Anisakis simplex]
MIELVNRSTRTMQKLIIDDGMKRVILKPGRLKIYRTVKLKQLIFGVLSLVAIVFTLVNAVSLHILPSVKKYLLPNPQIGYFSSIPIVSFETSMARLTVVDIATRDLNNRTTISRRLMNADREEITISVVALIQPNDMTSEKLDTSKLKVDTSKLSAAVRTLVSPPFASASLSLNTQSTSNVLIIGLGGSQMNNFLHHFFPHMNITVIELEQTMHDIALKYFGLSEDSNQRVIVMDGLEYLKEAADRGEKFDAVYIDACPTAFPSSEETLCPIHGFLDDVTIANLLAVLRGTGRV